MEQIHFSCDDISWYVKNSIIINFTGLVIPLPAVIVSLSVEDYKYNIHRFPPNICISDGPMWFYSITIIIGVLVGIGTYLLFVVFWIIHKVTVLFNNL